MEPQNQSHLPEPGPKSLSRRDLTKLFCTIVLGIISISLAIGFAPVLTVLALIHRWVAHQFFEVPQLASLRAESQMVLLRG